MKARYQIDLYSAAGYRMPSISKFTRMSVALREREPGVLDLDLPGGFDVSRLGIDSRLEVWRTYGASPPQLIGETAFFTRKPEFGEDDRGREIVRVTAVSALDIARRRSIPYNEGTTYTAKQGPADDVAKAIMRENAGALALDSARNLSAYLTIPADTGSAPQVTKKCDKAIALSILQEIAADLRGRGTYFSFDIVRINPSLFEFRTYIGWRGVNHGSGSSKQIVVSKDARTLKAPWVAFDHIDSANYVYAMGQGVGSVTATATASDAALIGLSPFNRCEHIHSATSTDDADELQAEAYMALAENAPKRVFTGKIQETDGFRFGIHFGFGDLITAEYRGAMYDCHIDYVQIQVDGNGAETIAADLRSEGDV